MEAIQFTANTKKLEYSKIPIPKISKPNEVLIKVAYAGICGTDLHVIQGEFPCNPSKTFTLGHEFSGTVVDVGVDVSLFKKGDKVSVDPNSGCRCCNHCHSGNPHFCKVGGINNTIGIYRDGGWAQYVLAPIEQVHKLPDTISLEQAALTEPVSCLSHGWDIISPIPVGSKILITGAGIIGNLWVCILHLQGHRRVTISEPNASRLNMLKKLNTGYDLITPDELKKRQSADPDYLFDVVIDCSGFPPAVEHAVSLLQSGGKLCCFGVAPPHGKITIAPFQIYLKELKIYGVNINPFSFPKSIGLLEAMGDRYLNYDNLGIKTFQLKDFEEAINCLKKGFAQRSPIISYISQTQIKDIGGTVELSCSVQYTQDYAVIWMKVDRGPDGYSLPISTGSALILHDSRFSLRYDPTSSTYLLQIKDIQETDAGYYQCQILISPSNQVSAQTELQVRRPPFISDNSTRSVVVSEGEAIQMECYAGGYPSPRISWRRENNAILPTGGSIYRGNIMKIKAIRKEDRGTYYCVAENGVGRGTKRNIAVEVEFAPVVSVPRPRLGQALQFDMDLECHVEAYPPPAITWEKDEITLSNNQHYKISHFAVADEFTDTTLRVITIEKRQYGQYVCKAANKLGTAEGRVELFESVIPVCPPACGSARYAEAATLSTSTAALFITLIILAYRNFHTQH